LFEHPTAEAMYAITPRDFKRFIAYVPRRAGYEVRMVEATFDQMAFAVEPYAVVSLDLGALVRRIAASQVRACR
jgi:hypothetical protein